MSECQDEQGPTASKHPVPLPPPEDDRALARMLGLSMIGGLAVWVAIGIAVF